MQTILNPVAAPREMRDESTPRIRNLTGCTIGILTNHWKSMDAMAARMQTRLKEIVQAADVRIYDIPINGAMSEAVKTAALAQCDAAIVGLAN